jgi:hypothetical protein
MKINKKVRAQIMSLTREEKIRYFAIHFTRICEEFDQVKDGALSDPNFWFALPEHLKVMREFEVTPQEVAVDMYADIADAILEECGDRLIPM